MGQKFCHREESLFLKSLVIEIFGPKETILLPVQYLAKYLVCPHKLFPDGFHVPQYEKKVVKMFFYWKDWLFFQKFLFPITF